MYFSCMAYVCLTIIMKTKFWSGSLSVPLVRLSPALKTDIMNFSVTAPSVKEES